MPARSGQTGVEVAVDPVDPATLGPVPRLVSAGNAYRIQASYQPSGREVEALGGQSSVGLVYPLLATAVADPGGHVVLSSADGRAWEALQSTDSPATHQVSARLARTGYVLVGVPPSAGRVGDDSRNRILLLGTGIAVVIVAAALVLRPRAVAAGAGRSRGAGDDHPPGSARRRAALAAGLALLLVGRRPGRRPRRHRDRDGGEQLPDHRPRHRPGHPGISVRTVAGGQLELTNRSARRCWCSATAWSPTCVSGRTGCSRTSGRPAPTPTASAPPRPIPSEFDPDAAPSGGGSATGRRRSGTTTGPTGPAPTRRP